MLAEIISRVRLLQELQVVRYGLAAVAATLVDLVLFYLLYNYWLHDFSLYVPWVGLHVTRQLASISISYSTGTLVNFFISKYFVFHEATGRGRHQLMRFLLGATLIFLANYALLWLLNWLLPQLLPFDEKVISVLARGMAALCVGVGSFTYHKFVTFKT